MKRIKGRRGARGVVGIGLAVFGGIALAAAALAGGGEGGDGDAGAPTRRERERALAALEEQLLDRDAAVRRRAVAGLAELPLERARAREAWGLVVGALADPKGEVADEAQWQLAKVEDARLVKALLGGDGLRSKDPLVRLRVAESFGRAAHGADGAALAGVASPRDPELAETLLWSIERLARAGRLGGDLGRCTRDVVGLARGRGAPRVQAQAIATLVTLDPSELLALTPQLAKSKEHQVRVALLDAWAKLDGGPGLDGDPGRAERRALAERWVMDAHPAVRLAALEAIAAGRDRRALERLVERLEVEERFRLRVACVEHLQALSGRKSKLDPRPWRLWIASLPEDWTSRDRAAPSGALGDTVSFAGLPLLSDRVSFLVDFSGSLWYEREGRPPRKLQVDALLRAALPRLEETTRFNVIPYTREPHPWREALVPATERNVRAALADFEACTENGSGNVFDAIQLALRDPDVDRLVVLTDGAPTGGARWKLDLMVPLLIQATRFDRVAIDAIVVDARPGLRKRWFQLAEATGGKGLAIEL